MKRVIAALTVIFSLVLAAHGAFGVMTAYAGGGGCTDADASGVSSPHSAPSGYEVSSVCIKSGANMFDDGHSGQLGNGTYENGCYTVSGVGTGTVTVTRNGSGPECQEISHIDAYYSLKPTMTPKPTKTPDPTATPTETPDPTATPTEGPSPTATATPTDGPSPTPTETQPPDPTATPRPVSTPPPSTAATIPYFPVTGAVAEFALGLAGMVFGMALWRKE